MFTDEEDEDSTGAVRYPCMPSLVALQQMRNRLHLSYLGRKLMKWSAMATSRELRKISDKIYQVYDSFGEDLGNAFMVLARARYFYPDMNKMVLENLPEMASVTVAPRNKAVSSVTCTYYEIIESGVEPYELLGIEKGGQKIHEAKIAWLDILRRVIQMLELRNNFVMVEKANRNATKRLNAIRKIVVPRTQVTIHYILLELEEMGREELFRIKLIKKKKAREQKKGEVEKKQIALSPICSIKIDADDLTKHKEDINIKIKPIIKPEPKVEIEQQVKPTPITLGEHHPATEIVAQKIENKPLIEPEQQVEPKPIMLGPICSRHPAQEKVPKKVEYSEVATKIIIEPEPKVETEQQVEPKPIGSCQICSTCSDLSEPQKELQKDDRLKYLKRILVEIIGLCRNMVEGGVNKINMEEFLSDCKKAKDNIEIICNEDGKTTSYVDSNMQDHLLHLKHHLREVIDLPPDSKNKTISTSSMEHLINICKEVVEKLDVYMKNVDIKPIKIEGSKSRLEHLKQHIKDVVKMTEDYKQQGLLTPSVEEFVKTCQSVQSKIDTYKEDLDVENRDVDRLNHLKEHVGQLEKLATDIKNEGMESSNLENFLHSCKDFKIKLEDYKKKAQSPSCVPSKDVSKLTEQIDKTIDLSALAKDEGLISESFDEFIKCCESMKKQITFDEKIKHEKAKPQTLGELRTNIDGVINLIKDLKAEGLITKSVEGFLEICESTKDKIDIYERFAINESEMSTETVPCSDDCSYDDGKEKLIFENSVCSVCGNGMQDTVNPEFSDLIVPCDSCSGIVKKAESKESSLCETCSETINPNLYSRAPPEEPQPPSSDSSLGYFETNVRKIVRVTRTLNEDGTVREEKETTIIRNNRHDPSKTSFNEDDDDDTHSKKYKASCALCLTSNQNQLGFRKSKSTENFKLPPMVVPNLRRCISIDLNMLKGGLPECYISCEDNTSVQSNVEL